MTIMIPKAQRCFGSDEHTRTRLLNRLGYFNHPIGTVAVDRSSLRRPLSMLSSTKDPANHSHPLAHRCHRATGRDAAPVMVNLNDERDCHYEGGSSCDIEDETISLESTSPTSCIVPLSPLGRKSTHCNIIQSDNNDNNRKNINIGNIGNIGNIAREQNFRRITGSPPNVKDVATFTTQTFKSPVVRFQEQATVWSIPSRHQYSNRIKKCLWSNTQELAEMAERNYAEFSAEGWDWHNVVLEQDMYIDSATGNLIHPCHMQAADPLPEDSEDACACDASGDPGCDGEDYFFRPLKRQPCVTETG